MTRTMLMLALIALGSLTSARAEVQLKRKLVENSSSTTTQKINTEQTLNIAGQDVDTKSDQTIVVTSEVGRRAEDGTIKIVRKTKSLKAKTSLPGGIDIEFDSANPGERPGTQFDVILDVLAATAKTTYTATYNKDNRVESIKVSDDGFKELDEETKKLFSAPLDAEYLKNTWNTEIDQIPNMSVRKGDSWELTHVARLEGGQVLTFKYKYTYAGTVGKLHKITAVATEVDYTVEGEDAPLKASDADLKIKSSEGAILFDNELGLVVEETSKNHITGSITFVVNDMELDSTLDLILETKETTKPGIEPDAEDEK